MASDVQVPAIGGVSRRTVEIIAGAGAAFVAWRWWSARSAANSAAVPTPVDTANTGADQSSVGYSNPGGIPLQTADSTGVILTDAQWTAAAESALAGLYDPTAVSNALGLYLSGQPLTGDQQLIVRAAWAIEGKPPQHPDQPIIPLQSPPAGTGSTGGSGATAAPHEYVADGTLSLNGLASARHTSTATIIALTAPHQPADVAAYLKLGSYSRALRKGTKWYTP
jgi:hypothetical protein